MSKSLKIALAEPSLIIRSGLISVLKRLPGYDIHILEIPEITFNQRATKKIRGRPAYFQSAISWITLLKPDKKRLSQPADTLCCYPVYYGDSCHAI